MGRFGSRTQSKVDYASYEIIVKEDIDTGIEKVIQDDSSFRVETDVNHNITVISLEDFDGISIYNINGVLQKRINAG